MLTVEPGLYIPEENIGIRIEDDVILTKDGCINLSKDIIKEVDDIENFFKEHNKYNNQSWFSKTFFILNLILKKTNLFLIYI